MADKSMPSNATRNQETRDARKSHNAGRAATADEAAAADENAVDADTRRSFEEMLERGADQPGEGRSGT